MKVSPDGSISVVTPGDGTVDCFDVAPDGELLYVAMRGDRLQELYACKDGAERRLTSMNEWVQQERALSTPEVLAYENDGCPLTGWVMKPVGFDPAKKYPVVLDIHGGH